MKKIHRLKTIGSAGFSLIEMLIALFVIGVIAAIAIPNIGGKKTPDKPITDGTTPALTDLKPGGSATTQNHELLASDIVHGWNSAVEQGLVKPGDYPSIGDKVGYLSKHFESLVPTAAAKHFSTVNIDRLTDELKQQDGGKLSLTKFEKGAAASTSTGVDKNKVGT